MNTKRDCTQHATQLIDDLVDANEWKLSDLVAAVELLARHERIILQHKLQTLIKMCVTDYPDFSDE